MSDIKKIFGKKVFNRFSVQKRLPAKDFKLFISCIENNLRLPRELADKVAAAMKDWAIEKGATHYTHWFQPLTGSTAEKHDSFINPTNKGNSIELSLSGAELTQGEPDASSFPSGGLRSTFEARGYTSWDYTSPAFLKEDTAGVTLCIPTAFCSYNGEALDKKTPLLRSMQAVNKQATKLLHNLGYDDVKKVTSSVGPEQEYFLVDKKYFAKRLDLITCGRTIFGANAPKGQELDDHYFGQIKDRVANFMKDLDFRLWEMGITAKSKHNEVAPSQFELASVYCQTNLAADQNQLVMETMKRVALRHDLVCLLHEKPYQGVNGSGKHNNWSLITDTGINLFEPGATPEKNQLFLVFLVAALKGFDKHADLLRASASNLGNEYRLGGSEAPPAIISVFLGDALSNVLDNIEKGVSSADKKKGVFLELGVDTLSRLPKDNTDRNRTSPLAFTGNKFEFRMVPSSTSISMPNVVLNALMAEELSALNQRLKNCNDINSEICNYLQETIPQIKRIIFNGDNYSQEYLKRAKKLGLPVLEHTAAAIGAYQREKAKKLFESTGILTPQELESRVEIYYQRYYKQALIEARTAKKMINTQYFPAIIDYIGRLARSIKDLHKIQSEQSVQTKILTQINSHFSAADENLKKLCATMDKIEKATTDKEKAEICACQLLNDLKNLRDDIDCLENLLPADIWPVPSYWQMMFKL